MQIVHYNLIISFSCLLTSPCIILFVITVLKLPPENESIRRDYKILKTSL